ncbi:hypothetical protein H6F56_12790 [Microcoleus sp. FACHB-672]|nr:hypothetical protein [Microcoleus sp. FACHB-672]
MGQVWVYSPQTRDRESEVVNGKWGIGDRESLVIRYRRSLAWCKAMGLGCSPSLPLSPSLCLPSNFY